MGQNHPENSCSAEVQAAVEHNSEVELSHSNERQTVQCFENINFFCYNKLISQSDTRSESAYVKHFPVVLVGFVEQPLLSGFEAKTHLYKSITLNFVYSLTLAKFCIANF